MLMEFKLGISNFKWIKPVSRFLDGLIATSYRRRI